MDPITILAAATACFEGVKKAVELGREVQDVYSGLSEWASHVDSLKEILADQKKKEENPSIWTKISFTDSITKVAFDRYAAEEKVKEMEKEIFHMFTYGDLCHLGIDGYRRFKQLREEERERRSRIISNQIKAKKEFLHNVLIWGAVALLVAFSIWVTWFSVDLILSVSK